MNNLIQGINKMIKTIEQVKEKRIYIVEEKENEYPYECHTVIVKGEILYSDAKNFQEYCKMHDKEFLLLSEKQFLQRAEKLEKKMCIDWFSITENWYEYQFEVLPPLKWRGNSFFAYEASAATLHAFYIEIGGLFYSGIQPIDRDLQEIKKDLFTAIKEKTVKIGKYK